MSEPLVRRSLRDELAFLLDSTVDLPADAYDRDTLLMRLECAFTTIFRAFIRDIDGSETDRAIRCANECMNLLDAQAALIESERAAARAAGIEEIANKLEAEGNRYHAIGSKYGINDPRRLKWMAQAGGAYLSEQFVRKLAAPPVPESPA